MAVKSYYKFAEMLGGRIIYIAEKIANALHWVENLIIEMRYTCYEISNFGIKIRDAAKKKLEKKNKKS